MLELGPNLAQFLTLGTVTWAVAYLIHTVLKRIW